MEFQPGNKIGKGRPRGSKNRRTTALAKARKLGLDPLDYALDIMRNTSLERQERMEAAKIALPYCHARLSSSHSTSSKTDKTQAEWAMEMADDIARHDSEQAEDAAQGVGEGNGDRGRGDDAENSGTLVTFPGGKAS